MQDNKQTDRLHSAILFSQSLLPDCFQGCLENCAVHRDYVLFLFEYALYVWFIDEIKGLPVPVLYNVYAFALVSKDCDDFFVISNVGDLLLARLHPAALLDPAEPSTAGDDDDDERSGYRSVEILAEISLADSSMDLPSCQLTFLSAYSTLVLSSAASPLASILSFDRSADVWTHRSSALVDMSGDMADISCWAIWGPLSDPVFVCTSNSSFVYFYPLQGTADDIVMKRSKHATWISAISSASCSACEWALTGDIAGYICIWQYRNVAVPEDAEEPIPSPWKLLWTDKALTAGSTVTTIILDNKNAWIADQSGRVTMVHVSLRSRCCHVMHVLHVFPRISGSLQMTILPQANDGIVVRIFASEWHECVECMVGKHIAAIHRVWPEGNLSLLANANEGGRLVNMMMKDPSMTSTRTLQLSHSSSLGCHGMPRKVVHACVVMPFAQLLAVTDWTTTVYFYDLASNALVHTMTSLAGQCTKLLAFDQAFADTSTVLLIAGHQQGTVYIYELSVHSAAGNEDDESQYSLQSISDDSVDSQGSGEMEERGGGDSVSSIASLGDSFMIDDADQRPVFDLLAPQPTTVEIGLPSGQLNGQPAADQRTGVRKPYTVTCQLMHCLQPGILPVTDLFLSNTAETLVVVCHRKHFFVYDVIAVGGQKIPRKTISVEDMLNHVSILHAMPDDLPHAHHSIAQQRLLLVLQSGHAVKLMDGLTLSFLTTFSIEQAAILGVKPKEPVHHIQGMVMWDYSDPVLPKGEDDRPSTEATGEHGLVGLCARDLLQFAAFSDKQGFKLLSELRGQILGRMYSDGIVKNLGLDSMMWSMVGYSSEQSPIVIAWSSRYVLLLRVQLHRDEGPMIMRTKVFHLISTPISSSVGSPKVLASSSISGSFRASDATNKEVLTGQVIYAQALPLLPKVRYHQVIIVLSSGFSFIVKL